MKTYFHTPFKEWEDLNALAIDLNYNNDEFHQNEIFINRTLDKKTNKWKNTFCRFLHSHIFYIEDGCVQRVYFQELTNCDLVFYKIVEFFRRLF